MCTHVHLLCSYICKQCCVPSSGLLSLQFWMWPRQWLLRSYSSVEKQLYLHPLLYAIVALRAFFLELRYVHRIVAGWQPVGLVYDKLLVLCCLTSIKHLACTDSTVHCIIFSVHHCALFCCFFFMKGIPANSSSLTASKCGSAQSLLLCCWHAMKEISLLMGIVVEWAPIGDSSNSLLTHKQVRMAYSMHVCMYVLCATYICLVLQTIQFYVQVPHVSLFITCIHVCIMCNLCVFVWCCKHLVLYVDS